MPHRIDIVDEYNQPTGLDSDIDRALHQGWWHRGIHMVVCTRTGRVLVQKRSSDIVMHPGFLDFSVAGYVDSGEAPETAALRELKEELGLVVAKDQLLFTKIYHQNHTWPKARKKNRVFVYGYVVILPDHEGVELKTQKSEVEWARFVPLRQLKLLIRKHKVKSLGRLEPTYAFYRKLLDDTERLLHTVGR